MIMNRAKRKRLEAAGWKFETVEEFLNLTPEEVELIELRLTLSRALKEERRRRNLSQKEVAKLLKVTQPRVSRMESGDPSISLDTMLRSLFGLGATNKTLGKTIAAAKSIYAA